MSNSQWPGNQNPSPWASQDPSWKPTQFHDAQGRDPRTPFGQPPQPGPSMQDLEPPRRPNSTLLIVVGVVALVGLIIVAMQFIGAPSAEPSASASPQSSASLAPSPERTGNWIPFEGNGDGTFEILSYAWQGDQLTARVRIDVQEGEYGFTLFAFANETRASFDPLDPSVITVRAGQPYEGEVVFFMPNADSTIVLATPSGRTALNALPVRAG